MLEAANDADPLRWRQLGFLAAAVLLSMALWFSASAVAPQLTVRWQLSSSGQAWLTMSVQLGFVAGALISAALNLADRWQAQRLMAACAAAGALANALIAVAISDATARTAGGFGGVLGLRFLTGVALAGVYPPGMKLMASWFRSGRGLAIGVLVGALTAGSAGPQLLATPLAQWSDPEAGGLAPWPLAPWRCALLAASASALLSAGIAVTLLRPGPLLAAAPRFDWSYCLRMWREPAIRRANFGYLGHMWELYAMWTWAPAFLLASYSAAGWQASSARVAAFGTVAIGGLGCVLAGAVADRVGRTLTTVVSLVVSGGCAVLCGFFFDSPGWATAICLVWGFAVVADSAQFSTAVTELCDARFVGTALTVQTCAGFLLTTLTIQLAPLVRAQLDWGWAFALLALGPAFGIWHMLRLREMPEAAQMASGNR